VNVPIVLGIPRGSIAPSTNAGGLQSPWERRLPACAKVAEWSLRPAQVGCLRTHWQAGSLRSQEKKRLCNPPEYERFHVDRKQNGRNPPFLILPKNRISATVPFHHSPIPDPHPRYNMLRKTLFVTLICFGFWCCPALAAEKQILPIEYWSIYNNDNFNNLAGNYYNCGQNQSEEEREKYTASLIFPNAVDSGSTWYGMTLTDGAEIWGIVALPLKNKDYDLESFDALLLRAALCKHPIIHSVFEDGNIRWYKQDNYLALVSATIPEEIEDRMDSPPKLYWNRLRWKAPIAYMTERPDRILLPELPPEEENEPPFVKRTRALRKKHDGKLFQEESTFLGLRWDADDESWEFLWETTAVEGTEDAKERERLVSFTEPFQVGGFCNSETGINASWRIVPDILFSGNTNLIFSGGITLLTPEEKELKELEDTKSYNFCLGWKHWECGLTQKKYVSDGSLYCFCFDQPEGIELREGIATPEILDPLNRTFAEQFLELLTGLRSSAMSTGGDKPIDLAAQLDDGGIYLALAFPSGLKPVEWNSFQKTVDVLSKMWSLPYLNDDGKLITDENWQISFQFSEPEICEGVSYRKFEMIMNEQNGSEKSKVLLFGVFGIGEDFFCLAVPNPSKWLCDWGFSFEVEKIEDLVTEKELLSEFYSAQLKQKVQDSRRLREEGMPTPTSLVRGNADGMRFRLENETVGRTTTYRLKIYDENSFGNVYLFARQLGTDLYSLVPF